MKKIFIDGEHGISGLTLRNKLVDSELSSLIEIISLDNTKDINKRLLAIKSSDISVLCLPDSASKEMCEYLNEVENLNTIIIDASRYHRTNKDWVYGYVNLNEYQLTRILKSKRISNPGCFAQGMLSLLNPLKDHLKPNYPLILNGITGYSAGGKKTIEKYQNNPISFRTLNLTKEHDHIKEVKHCLDLDNTIIFTPSIGSFFQGQMVSLVLTKEQINMPLIEIYDFLKDFYKYKENVKILHDITNIIPENMAGQDGLEIVVSKLSDEYIQLYAIYDNLGLGSSGAILNLIKKIITNLK